MNDVGSTYGVSMLFLQWVMERGGSKKKNNNRHLRQTSPFSYYASTEATACKKLTNGYIYSACHENAFSFKDVTRKTA